MRLSTETYRTILIIFCVVGWIVVLTYFIKNMKENFWKIITIIATLFLGIIALNSYLQTKTITEFKKWYTESMEAVYVPDPTSTSYFNPLTD